MAENRFDGFNGAAGFRPRRQNLIFLLFAGLLGFNGAAGFRPRRPLLRAIPIYAPTLLQWGRGLSPTETRKFAPVRRSDRQLQWGRGLSPTETPFSFRGVFQRHELQWGRGLSPTETMSIVVCAPASALASMGPRAFAHGDHHRRTQSHQKQRSFNGAAGFRPRRQLPEKRWRAGELQLQWGRGLSPTETVATRMSCFRYLRLQWGRGLSPTETRLKL